jgi:hypothetical protein
LFFPPSIWMCIPSAAGLPLTRPSINTSIISRWLPLLLLNHRHERHCVMRQITGEHPFCFLLFLWFFNASPKCRRLCCATPFQLAVLLKMRTHISIRWLAGWCPSII